MMKKRKLKKYISILLAVVLLFALFGCGKKQEPEPALVFFQKDMDP